jgi:chemotaxis signal transduction protein
MVAVDVSSVLRIDEMRAVEMFRHGDDAVFRYQDRVVPLRALAATAGSWNQIVVCEHGNVVIGLAVTEVLDVVTVPVQVTRGIGAPWAEGVGFVQGQPTALLDVSRLSAGGAA